IELRFNPMKRNVGGERDLDYIIAAALRGMDRACLDYGVKAGLIFCLAREFEYEPNEILVRKAEKYRGHGVIGIDLAGPEQHTLVSDRLPAACVRMTINTDGTYLLGTTLRKEFDLLLGEKIVSQAEARTYIGNARNASFIPR